MTEGEKPKKGWKNVFIGKNPVTGKPYFERKQVAETTLKEPQIEETHAARTAREAEERDEQKERRVREAMGLPPEED
ncbi:MAG: hypothetical protein P8Y17_00680 [Patescibacteria group bacterium]